MSIKSIQSLLLLSASLFTMNAQATFIDTEGHLILDFAEYGNFEQVGSYGGINWDRATTISDTGFGVDDNTAAVTLTSFFGQPSTMYLEADNSAGFDLYSAYFMVQNDNTTLSFVGEDIDFNPIDFNITFSTSSEWTATTLDLFNVSSLTITAEGLSGFAIDNVDVPEPSTLALLGMGLLGLGFSRRNQKK